MSKSLNQEWKSLRLLVNQKMKEIDTVLALGSENTKQLTQLKNELHLLIDDFIYKSQTLTILDNEDEREDENISLNEDEVAAITDTIKLVNQDFELFLTFMKSMKSSSESSAFLMSLQWAKYLFTNDDFKLGQFETSPFWSSLNSFPKLKQITGLTTTPIYEDYQANVYEGLEYLNHTNPKQWKIHFGFFKAVKTRFHDDLEKIKVATRLYLIHEAVHYEHRLTSYTVRGIGNFPKTVEEADYQADTYAILTEYAYQVETLKRKSQPIDPIKIILDIIDVAINTTFSFIPQTSIPLKRAQVRRVNRILIWAFQYRLIKFIDEVDDKIKFNKIFQILAIKPIVEIHGPPILVTNSPKSQRVIYILKNFDGPLTMSVFYNNTVRKPVLHEHIGLQLLEGLKETNFEKICEAMAQFFTAEGISLNL